MIVEFSLEFRPRRVYPEITKCYDLSAHKTSSSLRSISLIIIVATVASTTCSNNVNHRKWARFSGYIMIFMHNE